MTEVDRDVVVVGSGHNSLVAACYLAKHGLDVEVVERDTVIGGAVSTVERIPGYAMDRGSSVHVLIRYTGIVEELRLAEHGLSYVDLDPWGFAPVATPSGEQRGLHFHVNIDATCESIAQAVGEADAEAYRSFAVDWRRRNEPIFELFQGTPTRRRLGRSLWKAGRGTGRTSFDSAQQFLTSADALLDSHFESESLKGALAWIAAQSGPPPHEAATADLLGWNMVMHGRPPGRALGGSGMLTQALAARLASDGGTLRTGDGVARIVTDAHSGRAHGVVTESGDWISARAVVAGSHIATTLQLLDHSRLPEPVSRHLTEQRRRLRMGSGIGMAVRVAARDLPQYPSAKLDGSTWTAMQFLVSSRAHLRAAYGDFLAGRLPQRPAVLAMTTSAVDPGTAPPGRHNITLWGQWHPYELAGRQDWDAVADRAARDLIAEVEAVAPGFTRSVEDYYVQSPQDLESEMGLLRGNVMHLEMSLDSVFAFRPTPDLSGHRVVGVPGLYLTGASTHPGGGVFGASGRTVASIVRDEWKALGKASRAPRPAKVPQPRHKAGQGHNEAAQPRQKEGVQASLVRSPPGGAAAPDFPSPPGPGR